MNGLRCQYRSHESFRLNEFTTVVPRAETESSVHFGADKSNGVFWLSMPTQRSNIWGFLPAALSAICRRCRGPASYIAMRQLVSGYCPVVADRTPTARIILAFAVLGFVGVRRDNGRKTTTADRRTSTEDRICDVALLRYQNFR